ncbi:LacI family transcriptional regulator [Allokutzneria sp. A3M-2-11 16]|uniref:LacI family DNA-binding transcriptional regulator n=1 Tax=Allokutzneria sp. A3M-2-11 16 TaxID=2962043 RepID=UPI0020B83224|nr:LacI family DNA-binding transcriptional regulator [Allokutzneria sp. A3M-2-11 16]MCP3799352.1 LacI family transcriptional regulator [Allokutzneria sp. A3M-2-11 16]
MRDVARLAGVSITTVSHVVNGTRQVAEATRQRVLDAVARTGYTGNAIARSLVTGGTRTLGVAISLVANPYFAELMQAIEGEASAAGFTPLLIDTHDEAEAERAAVRALRSRRVDGLLLTPSHRASANVLPELRQLGVPTVLVDRLPADGQFDQVGPENVGSTAALVTHLAERGHRRIGLVSGAAGLTTSAERTQGYRLGLHRAGLPADEALMISGESRVQQAADALRRLAALPEPPTAVVAGNNNMLVGVLRAARELGIRVGEELAVVCYDEVEWAELVDPPMTTMAQPITEIGRTAVRMLLARIADPARPPRTVRLPARLMHRRSCGCP